MAGIFSALGTLESVFKTVLSIKEDPKNAVKEYEKMTKQNGLIKVDGSITKLLSKYIVEPVVIVSKDARNTEVADKLIQLNTDIFSSFYLQAFHVLNNLYGFEAAMTINLLSTDNSTAIGTIGDKAIKTGLQWYAGNEENRDYFSELLDNKYLSLSFEASKKDKIKKLKDKLDEKRNTKIDKLQEPNMGDSKFKQQDEMDKNLYYVNHRELTITMNLNQWKSTKINDDTNPDTVTSMLRTVIIPITIKTHIIVTPFDNILNMLKPNDRTKTFGYRLDEWKSGAISLADLIFCGDLIKPYKKAKLKDKDGLINIIKQREESANAKVLDNKRMIGFEKNYNMLICTADEKVLLNKHIGGSIDNERYKDELLTQAHALTVSIVDDDYERAYIMTKDIRGRSDISYKMLNKRDKNNSELGDIVKALMSNKAPVF